MPAARAGHAAVWDAAGQRMLIFGGADAHRRLNDVYVLTTADWTWHRPVIGGSGRAEYSSEDLCTQTNQVSIPCFVHF